MSHPSQSGTVRMKQAGLFSWLWRSRYLVLKEETLTIHKSDVRVYTFSPNINSELSYIVSQDIRIESLIRLSEITNLERTTRKPHCLLLETKNRRIYLSLGSDEDLYGWQDAINSRRFSTTISLPYDFKHHVHVCYDPDTAIGYTVSSHFALSISTATSVVRVYQMHGGDSLTTQVTLSRAIYTDQMSVN